MSKTRTLELKKKKKVKAGTLNDYYAETCEARSKKKYLLESALFLG